MKRGSARRPSRPSRVERPVRKLSAAMESAIRSNQSVRLVNPETGRRRPHSGGRPGPGGSPIQGGPSAPVQAVFDRMSALSPTEESAIEAFVDGLVADGIWGSIDEFYCFALNGTDYLTGWKFATATEVGSLTKSGNGLECDNQSSHVDTGVDLGALGNYSLNDGEAGVYIHSAADWGANNFDFGGSQVNGDSLRLRHQGTDTNTTSTSINGSFQMLNSRTLPQLQGLLYGAQVNTQGETLFDGVVQGATQATITNVPSGQNMWLFRNNSSGSPSNPSQAGIVLTSYYVGSQINTVQFLSRLNTLHTALGVS